MTFMIFYKLKRRLLYLFLFLVASSYAQSGYVGQSIYLSAPSVPGTLRTASWISDVDKGLLVTGGITGATVTIYKYFSGTASVTCSYTYMYKSNGQMQYSNIQRVRYDISCIPSTLLLNERELHLKPGDKAQLTYTNSSGYDPYAVEWSTSDYMVADFDGESKIGNEKTVTIKAHDIGECLITCEGWTGNTAPVCKVIVSADPPTGIKIVPDKISILEGKTEYFNYELTPKDAYTKVSWKSSNESVATVTSGKVTAISEGTAVITVTTDNGLSANGEVEVVPIPRQVTLPSNKQLYVGYSVLLMPELIPANARTSYKWEVSDPKIATIDESGRVKGRKDGTVNIVVTTDNGKSASCSLTVKSPAKGMDSRNVHVRHQTLVNLINGSIKK